MDIGNLDKIQIRNLSKTFSKLNHCCLQSLKQMDNAINLLFNQKSISNQNNEN